MNNQCLEIKTGRWAWFGEEHGRLRTSPFRDLLADLARLEEHNPVLCLYLGAPVFPSARDLRLTDLGLGGDCKGLREALKHLPAGLGVIEENFEAFTAKLVLGRKGAAIGRNGIFNPKGRTVAASTRNYCPSLGSGNDEYYHYSYGPGGSKGNMTQLKSKDDPALILTALRASPLKYIHLWDIRPGLGKKADAEMDDSRVKGYDAPDGCALTILQKLKAKLNAALDGCGCDTALRHEGKTEAERLDAVIAGTEPKFWFGEVRNAYMPPDHGLARHLEETYNRLLKRKSSRFLFWRTRRLAAAMRRVGLAVPSKITKGLGRLKKLRRAETGNNG